MRPDRSLLVALALLALAPATARASAPVGAEGASPRLTAEDALIVWDAVGHMETLALTAKLEPAGSHGLIVPTPTPPRRVALEDLDGTKFLRALSVPKPLEPRVSAEGKVAFGSVPAADTKALDGWLAKQKLAPTPELEAWGQRYVQSGGTFALLATLPSGELPWVTVTFSTPHPLYPLRATARATGDSSAPAVWLLANDALVATVGNRRIFPEVVSFQPLSSLRATLGEERTQTLAQGDITRTTWLGRFVLPAAGDDDAIFEPQETPPEAPSTRRDPPRDSPEGQKLAAIRAAATPVRAPATTTSGGFFRRLLHRKTTRAGLLALASVALALFVARRTGTI